jgi:hypothetical protein
MSASLPSRDEQSQPIPLFQDEPRVIRLAVMLYILFPLSLPGSQQKMPIKTDGRLGTA